MKIYVGCDHAGLELKLKVMAALPEIDWQDMGTHSPDSTDYPDYANKVCEKITEEELSNKKHNIIDPLDGNSLGLLICGSGQGMAIRANRFSNVRAALCWNEDIARLSRQHNNANILCLGQRFVPPDVALKILKVFLETKFEGGRHQNRVNKLSNDTGC